MSACPSCGREVAEGFRFCPHCGAPLEAAPTPSEVRKVVTVLFIDVTGSTALGERLDPEALRRVMSRYFDVVRGAVEAHGGTVEKFIGDAVMAVFGLPTLHEDDALRAARAALEARGQLEALNEELERDFGVRIQTRTGINTGEVIAGDASSGQAMATGDAVNAAARLEQAAQPGQILIGQSTWRLTRNAVNAEPVTPLQVKGKEAPLAPYRLIAIREGAEAVARWMGSPLVGRANELALAQDAFARAAREQECHLFTIFGPPGVGKSRLSAEILARVEGEATVLRGRCLPYGKGITFWPLVEIIRASGGLAEGDTATDAHDRLLKLLEDEDRAELIADRLVQLIGLGAGVAETEELFWAVRRLFESLARRRPLVVVFDDIHWAEPTLLDLIDHVADWSRDAPLLLLCIARPELMETRSGWGGGKRNASTILLEPLNDDESEELIANLLGGPGLPGAVRLRIADAAEGNPLFVEQLVAMLIDDDVLVRSNGSWEVSGELSAIAIPPTIQLLLAARLDRLGEEERRVIQAASVVGKEFWRGAVTALLPEGTSAGAALSSLVRKDLVQPERSSSLVGEDTFRFRHILIRDAAYQALPKEARSEMHERFADWLTGAVGERLAEYEEIVAYHLQEAYRHRVALGPPDDRARSLAARAGRHLASAGRRALDRGDGRAAANLLERARGLLDPCPVEILLDLVGASWEAGQLDRAQALAAEAKQAAGATGDRHLEWRAVIEDLTVRRQQDSEGGVSAEAKEVAPRAIEVFEERGDDRYLARAWLAMANAHNNVGEHSAMLDAAKRALEHARRAGDMSAEQRANVLMSSAMIWGRTPVAEALPLSEVALEESLGTPLLEAAVLRPVAVFRGMVGEFEEARRLLDRSQAIYTEFGRELDLATIAFSRGPLEWWARDLEASERSVRECVERLERMGEHGWLSTIAAFLARVLCEQGRYEEAEEYVERAMELAAKDDLVSQIMWRSNQAKILAKRGQAEEALALANEAVEMANSTEGLLWQADSYQDMAMVMRLLNRPDDEKAALQEAIARYEAKGVDVEAARLRNSRD
jgi:class 3 adenylate cyclase/tetratricopeptide (TPR) repeat protein